MIIGIGTDILNSDRILQTIEQFGSRFFNRIFTKNEKLSCLSHLNSHMKFAKKFAAKEAVLKAIGSGYTHQISFRDIEILNDELGKPVCVLCGIASEFLLKKIAKLSGDVKDAHNNYQILVSISDDVKYVSAFCVIEI